MGSRTHVFVADPKTGYLGVAVPFDGAGYGYIGLLLQAYPMCAGWYLLDALALQSVRVNHGELMRLQNDAVVRALRAIPYIEGAPGPWVTAFSVQDGPAIISRGRPDVPGAPIHHPEFFLLSQRLRQEIATLRRELGEHNPHFASLCHDCWEELSSAK